MIDKKIRIIFIIAIFMCFFSLGGDNEEAEKYFYRGYEKYHRGVRNSCEDDIRGAIKDFNIAIKLNPEYKDAYVSRGDAKQELGNVKNEKEYYREAIEDYNKAIDLGENNTSVYIGRGTAKYLLKDYNGAISDYSKSIELSSEKRPCPGCYFLRGLAKFDLGNLDGAEQDYSNSIKLDKNNKSKAETYRQRGLVRRQKHSKIGWRFKTREILEAIEDYDKSIELNPKNWLSYSLRAECRNEIFDYNGTIEDCNKVIELYPEFQWAYYLRGKNRRNLVSISEITEAVYKEILWDFNKAIELDPNCAPAYYERGRLKDEIGAFKGRGQIKSDSYDYYKGAIQDYTKAIELKFEDPDLYLNSAQLKMILEDYVGAIPDFSKCIKLKQIEFNENMKEIKKKGRDDLDYEKSSKFLIGKVYTQRSDAKMEVGDYIGAIQDINKAIKLKEEGGGYEYFNKGYCKYRLSDYRKAILDFSKAIELSSDDSEIYFFRGLCKIFLNDKNGGCLDFSKAGELGYVKAYDAIKRNCQ